ncbi:bifunctional dethiobiotin synthetase/7,8-diamino-pelargonic acid aminotransferase, mitochondrial [Cocos nucifera]|uniref:Bifunctional dethiobiotin synthetase/7,8-diamino-pelargonic acid aminotransferase, mitochondrial n=1 Tax=Cocos nucifera TaxID=13894 RepID=A0A8K0HUT2_COCNU|nr:bifunctional dethiobiotin synthetase/7,8-diamino-pelargonic acid aminotransferase, mitochondrial [Cocos nucifera]
MPSCALSPFLPRRRPLPSPLLLLLLSRSLHSSPPELDLSHPTLIVWGSNTGVGKTLVSAGLAASVLSPSSPNPSTFVYLKPVQTGFPRDSDSRFVYRKVSDLFRHRLGGFSAELLASNHALKASVPAARQVLGARTERPEAEGEEASTGLCWYEETRVGTGESTKGDFKLVCKTLYGWKEAISPHLAVEREGMTLEDSSLREVLGRLLNSSAGGGDGWKENVWRVIETAGGVASPGPSGSIQCDLYRPFRLPAVLVGDGHLGGISTTLSAYESLTLRGYDVIAIILADQGLSNEVPLLSYLRHRVPVLVLPPVPEDPLNDLVDWFCESSKVFSSLQDLVISTHSKSIQRLHDMPRKAGNILWWPFTQHKLVPEEIVTVIDSRCGENFAVHKVRNDREMIVPQFDACASWWTQGPDFTLQIELARDMGYSAARYGHVMFPENVYEPALHCAELLLEGVGKGWASRTYYSDNGSTAIEIALKMAFRKFLFDNEIHMNSGKGISSEGCIELRVLALNGSYHGDTLGAMEAQAPSSYTGFLQQPWYSGRGLFLDPPTIFIHKEIWNLSVPESFQSNQLKPEDMRFRSSDVLFCPSRDSSAIAEIYSACISNQLLQFSKLSCSTRIGALIIEPVIQAAGGMHMIDPLFQRILVRECRSRRIPVIFDEVFTGFWRLGRESAAELLGCVPDVACFGKLMSGGIIPLAVTLTTESVFEAFKGDSKLMALLHGHSYTAHAMGCTAAAKAIQWFKDPITNPNVEFKEKKLKELWEMKLVLQISSLPAVQRVMTLGTVCAVELKAEGSDAGYASLYASFLVQQLREDGLYVRPLGNVIYLMCGPCTSSHFCSQQLKQVYRRLYEFSQRKLRDPQSFQKRDEP